VHQYLVFNGLTLPGAAPDHLPPADVCLNTPLGDGRSMLTEDYRVAGRIVARLIRVTGLGHAWSGGDPAFTYNDPHPPDATTLFGAFFASQLR
jgi:hypothetical protein